MARDRMADARTSGLSPTERLSIAIMLADGATAAGLVDAGEVAPDAAAAMAGAAVPDDAIHRIPAATVLAIGSHAGAMRLCRLETFAAALRNGWNPDADGVAMAHHAMANPWHCDLALERDACGIPVDVFDRELHHLFIAAGAPIGAMGALHMAEHAGRVARHGDGPAMAAWIGRMAEVLLADEPRMPVWNTASRTPETFRSGMAGRPGMPSRPGRFAAMAARIHGAIIGHRTAPTAHAGGGADAFIRLAIGGDAACPPSSVRPADIAAVASAFAASGALLVAAGHPDGMTWLAAGGAVG